MSANSQMPVERIEVSHLNAVLNARLRGIQIMTNPRVERALNGIFIVRHDLGFTPLDFGYSRIDDVSVRATRADRKTWSDTHATLRGSAEGDVSLWFVARIGTDG